MYYHSRGLKFVEYGKVYPPPIDEVDECMFRCYKWLSYYCGGFCPQVWLSRSRSSITGFKTEYNKENEGILFGFDIIAGSFPISYEPWEFLMNTLLNIKDGESLESTNKKIADDFKLVEKDCIEYKEEPDGELRDWIDCGRNLDEYLKKHVFVEKDQVVVPSLNLKLAKKIICRNERQKKVLRKMGFIEDRIIIKNIKTHI